MGEPGCEEGGEEEEEKKAPRRYTALRRDACGRTRVGGVGETRLGEFGWEEDEDGE